MKGIGADWTAFSGDIFISDEITIGGFRASGLSVRVCSSSLQSRSIETTLQDYLVLTMTPSDVYKPSFKELRMVVPIRLATDRWNDDSAGWGVYVPSSSSSSEELAAASELLYASS